MLKPMDVTIVCLYSVCNNPVPEREEFDNANKACALIAFSLSTVWNESSCLAVQHSSAVLLPAAFGRWEGCGGECGDLTKENTKVSHPGAGVILAREHSEQQTEWLWTLIHRSCHYPWTRALQASRDGQRKAPITRKLPTPTTSWIPYSDTSCDGVTLDPPPQDTKEWTRLPAVPNKEQGFGTGGGTCHTVNSE